MPVSKGLCAGPENLAPFLGNMYRKNKTEPLYEHPTRKLSGISTRTALCARHSENPKALLTNFLAISDSSAWPVCAKSTADDRGHRLELMRHYGLGFVRHQMGSLRHFLAWLKSTDASQVNPALDVPPLKAKRSWPKRKTTETGQKPDGRFKKPVDLPRHSRPTRNVSGKPARAPLLSRHADCRKHGLTQFFEHLKTIGVADLRDVVRQMIADYRLASCPLLCWFRSLSDGSLRHFFAWLESTDAICSIPP